MELRSVIIRSNQIAPDSRVEKEAAALSEHGYDVTILAWDRSSNHQRSSEIVKAFNENIPIIRFGHKARFGEGMKSLKSYLAFQCNIFCWLIQNRNKYDIIHACDFDTAFTSTIANLFLRKKYIFDIFDYLYGERKTSFQKIICKLQDWIINRSDVTIICTEDRKRQICYAKPKKVVVIHNSPPKISYDLSNNATNEKIKICYVGILQDYRLLKEIPEFFKKYPEFELHIGGFGKYEELYQQLSSQYPNIHYYGALKYQETLALENSCDIMLAIYDPSIENHVFAAPNKFYEGLMIGKPLIMAKGTDMSSIVEKNRIGEVIEFSVEGFEKGILNLASRRKEWSQITEKMQYIYENFSWDEMKIRLCETYHTLK